MSQYQPGTCSSAAFHFQTFLLLLIHIVLVNGKSARHHIIVGKQMVEIAICVIWQCQFLLFLNSTNSVYLQTNRQSHAIITRPLLGTLHEFIKVQIIQNISRPSEVGASLLKALIYLGYNQCREKAGGHFRGCKCSYHHRQGY